jgi:hypothetical protein
MPTYLGGNHRLTLEGVRAFVENYRDAAKKEMGPFGSRKRAHIRAEGEWHACNFILANLEIAIASGPTPPAIVANILAEKAAKDE